MSSHASSHAGPRALVLTGTIGAGKTTLAEAVSERLHERGERHGLLDLDWLGQLYPPRETDPYDLGLALENLAAIVPNFVARGIETLVMAATITTSSELRGVRSALIGFGVTVGLVTASSAELARRIGARDSGRLRADFLARTDALADQIRRARLEDFTVENRDGALDAAVDQVMDRLG